MATIKCKMCGGTMEITENSTVAVCEYCGSQQTIPRLSDERKANLYDRANHFRRNNEFDKAQAIYEQILNEDSSDAESYWSLVLCKYGIEYVEDPSTHRMVPTVNRTQFTSVFEDSNYKEAIRLSDESQRAIYEEEAKAIDDIQKGILEISKNEEPFDVFICYKETDESGKRTRDSVLGQDLYYELKKAGFKVFFSRITLESKLGTAYEPYIFSALNSSKVMVVIGTKAEYFKAVWVRNEWSRFLDMMKRGEKKTLIPAYRDMDPYDLPEEFSFLQAQDMSKLGFMQDLVQGVIKITGKLSSKMKEAQSSIGSYADDALVKNAMDELEEGDWTSAKTYAEKAVESNPKNSMAYLIMYCAEKGWRLTEIIFPDEKNKNYKKAVHYADSSTQPLLEKGKQLYEKCCTLSNKLMELIEKEDDSKEFGNRVEDYATRLEKLERAPLLIKKIVTYQKMRDVFVHNSEINEYERKMHSSSPRTNYPELTALRLREKERIERYSKLINDKKEEMQSLLGKPMDYGNLDSVFTYINDETERVKSLLTDAESIPCSIDQIKSELVRNLPKNILGSVGPAGGIVCYDSGDNSKGWRYIEAYFGVEEFIYKWGDDGRIGTSTTVGSGKSNTRKIYKKSKERIQNIASACIGLSLNGYDDWFLPSRDEMELICKNLKKAPFKVILDCYFHKLACWTSSEVEEDDNPGDGPASTLAWLYYYDDETGRFDSDVFEREEDCFSVLPIRCY